MLKRIALTTLAAAATLATATVATAPFQPAAAQKWESALYFRVFETDPHFRGKTGLENEPHDYAAFDLNGDGRLDLCLLTHDRALLYVRKK